MAGGGGPAKSDADPAPHPAKDQLPNVSYCITSPPRWRESLTSTVFSLNLDSGFYVMLF